MRQTITSKKFLCLRDTRGFTLVEIMVTLLLLSSFTAIGLSYNRSTDEQIGFFRDEGKLISELYRVKSLALSTYVQGGNAACGYGLAYTQDSGVGVGSSEYHLVIFRDVKDPSSPGGARCKDYGTPGVVADQLYNPAWGEFLETIELGEIQITNVTFDSLLFVPPYSDVYTNGETPGPDGYCISIQSSKGAIREGIYISSTGQVSTGQVCP